MGINLGDAFLFLGAKDEGLRKDLDNAEKDTKSWTQRVSDGIGLALGQAVVKGVGMAVRGVANLGGQVVRFSLDTQTAVKNLQSELGTTEAEARTLGQIAGNVWKNNFTGSVIEAADAVGFVRQQMRELNAEGIQDATQVGLALQEAYGQDFEKVISAARTLMDDFNLSQQEAMDFMAEGFQRGLNRSDDFLETITEYAPQFSSAQVGAEAFFSAMETGAQGGMLGTDRALDMFKEFRVRLLDGSATTAEGLQKIGLSVDDITASINDGSLGWDEAFTMVQDRLRGTGDQATQMQAGVALLGTQFEDMGTQAALATSLAGVGLEEMAGSADEVLVRYESIQSVFQSFGRRMVAAFAPASDAILGLVNDNLPQLEGMFSRIEANISTFATGFVAVIRGMAGVVGRIFRALRGEGESESGAMAGEAGSWGRNVVMQFARGMASAATAVVRVLNQIGQLISSWLKPGSPPKLLPDIDKWGTGAMDAWVEGMTKVDLKGLKDLGARIMGTLGTITDAGLVSLFSEISGTIGDLFSDFGDDEDTSLVAKIVGGRAAVAQAIEDLQTTGTVGEAAYHAIEKALEPLPDVAMDYVEAMLEMEQANQRVKAAQEEVNRVTQEYQDRLDPLKNELQELQDAQADEQDQKRIAELQKAIARGNLSAEDELLAKREIRRRQLQMEIRQTENQRDAALDAANEELTAAEEEAKAVEDRLKLQKALIQAQKEQQNLTKKQVQLLEQLATAMGSMGEALAEGLGGAGGGGLGEALEGLAGGADLAETMGEALSLDGLDEALDIDGLVDDILAEFDPLTEGIAELEGTWSSMFTNVRGWWEEHGGQITGIIEGFKTMAVNAFGGLWEGLQLKFEAFKLLFEGDFEGFVTTLFDGFETSLTAVAGLFGDLWKWAQPHLSTFLTNFVNWAKEQDWKQISTDIMKALAEKLEAFWLDHAKPVLITWWDSISEWFQETDWKQLALDVIQMLIDGWLTFWELAATVFAGWFTSITQWFEGVDWQSLGYHLMTELLTALETFVTDLTKLPAVLKEWWDTFWKWVTEDVEWSDLATEMIDGIVSGITSGISRVAAALRQLGQGMLQAWDDFWENRSPSKVMQRSMGDLADGIQKGAEMERHKAQEAVASLVTDPFSLDARERAQIQSLSDAAGRGIGEDAPVQRNVHIENVNLQDSTAVEAFLEWLAGVTGDNDLAAFGSFAV